MRSYHPERSHHELLQLGIVAQLPAELIEVLQRRVEPGEVRRLQQPRQQGAYIGLMQVVEGLVRCRIDAIVR